MTRTTAAGRPPARRPTRPQLILNRPPGRPHRNPGRAALAASPERVRCRIRCLTEVFLGSAWLRLCPDMTGTAEAKGFRRAADPDPIRPPFKLEDWVWLGGKGFEPSI